MILKKKNRHIEIALAADKALPARIGDAVSFWSVILFSAAVVAAIALATPFVLAIAAAAGLVAGNSTQSTWRPVRA